MEHATAIEVGKNHRGVVRAGALALALFLVPCAVRGADYYYPEFKKDPAPPVAVVEEIVTEDVEMHPTCNAANDACDDPDASASALAEAALERATLTQEIRWRP